MGASVSPRVRRAIDQAFTGQYREDCGSAELGCIACDCAHTDGLHVYSDLFYVEILSKGKCVANGQQGKIIITDLHNKAMPFIRYEIGDVGRMTDDPCPCGCVSPRLYVEGRLQDTIVTTDGRIITPDAVSDLILVEPSVDMFQLIEESPGRFELLLVPKSGETVSAGALADKIRALVGDDVAIRTVLVDTITPENGGKYRNVKSSSYNRLD